VKQDGIPTPIGIGRKEKEGQSISIIVKGKIAGTLEKGLLDWEKD